MGTAYMVKIFDPPAELDADWEQRVDAELRRVNDQMSTYLESSELSRFNASASTDWFGVSEETAMVVAKSLEIHRLSGGAFDVTVAPLVNVWSFGPGKRSLTPPDDATIESLRTKIGSVDLAARLDPPAIRKSRPELTIDLSAIAKGHGVDRVVALLNRLGAANVFVEIGGEVRVTGDKAGRPWTVGIQKPDVAGEVVAVAYPLRDRAVATSGDYRNFFEFDGKRYSHTIDPRTGRPVDHNVASVSVLADDCMTADAWATAFNVLGTDASREMADSLGLHTLIMSRDANDQVAMVGTGDLAEFSNPATAGPATAGPATAGPATAGPVASDPAAADAAKAGQEPGGMRGLVGVVLIVFVAFAVVIGGMAIGVMFGRRSISGSCGGLANRRDPDGNVSCALCSNPDNACRELKEKMQSK
jgi:thiamine biosynthesis lipoprotein